MIPLSMPTLFIINEASGSSVGARLFDDIVLCARRFFSALAMRTGGRPRRDTQSIVRSRSQCRRCRTDQISSSIVRVLADAERRARYVDCARLADPAAQPSQ